MLENNVIAVIDVIEDGGPKTKKPPLIPPLAHLRFSTNSRTTPPANPKTPNRAGGRTAVIVAVLPCRRHGI